MALVQFSGFVESVKGKLGGLIYQENAAGPIVRARCAPVNRNTARQNVTRNLTARLQAEWLGLTEIQRNLWKGYANYAPTHQMRNTALFINGQQAFLKANNIRVRYDLTVLKEPQFNKCDITPIGVRLERFGPNLFANFDRLPVPTEEFVSLFVSIPLPVSWNTGRSFPKLINFVTPAAMFENITAEYTAVFGFIPVVTDTVFLKFTNADKRSGYQFPYKSIKQTL